MIKFFRHIRQNLLTEGKTGKYFKYAIGEIVLVVIGILIALQINNWNENRKLDNLKQNYYQQILEDIEIDKNYAEDLIKIFNSSLTLYNNYNETFKKPNLPLSVMFYNLRQNRFENIKIHFKSTTLKTLISNGDIKLMDTKLRNHLISYNANKEHILDVYGSNTDYALDILKNLSMYIGSGDLSSKIQNQPELVKLINLEKRYPDIFLKAEAYLEWKFDGETKIVEGLKDLLKDIEITAELINPKLEK